MAESPQAAISAAIVLPVVHALGELGYQVTPGRSPDAVLADAAEKLNDGAIGLSLAAGIPIGALGDVDYALCTSPTLRAGITRLTRFYAQLTRRVRPELVEAPPSACLRYVRVEGLEYSRHWREFALGMVAVRVRQVLGKELVFEGTRFAHPPPRDAAAHDAFFGTRVAFSGEDDRLVFPLALLESPLRTAAPALAELLETRMLKLEEGSGDTFVTSARVAVRALLEQGKSGVEPTAQKLAISGRTLQRQLQQRGTSVQQVLDEVRRAMALELLEAGDLSVEQVSQRLGFSEPSAFFRAFRKWTGMSPRAAVREARR